MARRIRKVAEKGNWYKHLASKPDSGEGAGSNKGSVGPKPDVQSWSLGQDGDHKVE